MKKNKYLQQMERYKNHAQNVKNISTVSLQNTNKQNVKIIFTWKRNQLEHLQIISDDLSQCK